MSSPPGPEPTGSFVANLAGWVDRLPFGPKVVGRLLLARAEAGAAAEPGEIDDLRTPEAIAARARDLGRRLLVERVRFFPADQWEPATAEAGSARPGPATPADADRFATRLGAVASGASVAGRQALAELLVRAAPIGDRAPASPLRPPTRSGTALAAAASDQASAPDLPTFLVVGALKAGTTSVAAHVAAHPDVFVPTPKELSFFSYDFAWFRGVDWYRSCFAAGAEHAARGEVAPLYAWWPSYPGVPERAASVVPDARIVYVVRDPVDRLRSMYRQAVRFGGERRPFAEVVLGVADYLDTARYSTQLDRWAACFPADRIRVVATEALRDEPEATMAEIHQFLGVADGVDVTDGGRRHNVTPPDGLDPDALELPPPIAAIVTRQLAPEVERLRPWFRAGAEPAWCGPGDWTAEGGCPGS